MMTYYILSVNCEWSSWSSPLSCSKSCGGGAKLEIRHKTVIENHGGTCSGSFHQKTDCNTQSCPGRFQSKIYYTIFDSTA